MRYRTKSASNWAATASFYKSRLQYVLSEVPYSPSHRQTGARTINFRSTLRSAPICVKMDLLYYLVAMVIHIQSVRCQICVCVHILCTIWRRWSGKGNKKYWDSSECCVPSKSFIVPLWTRLPYVRRSWPRDYGQLHAAETGETKQGSKTLLRVTAVLSHDGPRSARVSCTAASFSGGQCFTSQHRDRISHSTLKCHFKYWRSGAHGGAVG
jgi:hypothetical protein